MAKKIHIPVFADARGELGAPLTGGALPFTVGNVFFIRGVPPGVCRGGHAHKECAQALFCLSGGLKVLVDDAIRREEFLLDSSSNALLIEPGEWAEEYDFLPGTVVMVIASLPYKESDYLRDYASFLEWKSSHR